MDMELLTAFDTPRPIRLSQRWQNTAKDNKSWQKTLFIENIYAACDEIKLNAQTVLLLLTLHTYFAFASHNKYQSMASGQFSARKLRPQNISAPIQN